MGALVHHLSARLGRTAVRLSLAGGQPQGKSTKSAMTAQQAARDVVVAKLSEERRQSGAWRDADLWPDETGLLDLDAEAVCTKCGMIGADVRPNWSERPPWRA